ncbi:helix-turn-helix transcriptional regulator, partial [Dietzia sp. DQ12-76]|nr:helix-turn-helix transcriptional regulator [Dietzia sp. DQ12-76]
MVSLRFRSGRGILTSSIQISVTGGCFDRITPPDLACNRSQSARGEREAPVSGLREDGLTRLGSRIRHHRQQLGLTLVEVAGHAGISQPFLSQIERGKAAPSMSTLEGLAHALGTTQAHLLEAVDSGDQAAGRPTTTDRAASGGG